MTLRDYRTYLNMFKNAFSNKFPMANCTPNAVIVLADSILRAARKGGEWDGDHSAIRVRCAMKAIAMQEDVPESMTMSIDEVERLEVDLDELGNNTAKRITEIFDSMVARA